MNTIIFLFPFFLNSIIYLLPTCFFLPFKMTLCQKIGFYFLILINILFMGLYVGNAGVILLIFSCCLYISFLHKNRIINICVFISTYLFCVVCDNVFSLFWDALFYPVSKLRGSAYYYIMYLLSFILFMTFLCSMLAKFVQSFTSKMQALVTKQLMLLISSNLLICLLIFVFNIVFGESIGYNRTVIGFNCILFGTYFIISNIMIVNIVQAHMDKITISMRQETYDRLQEYTTQIENMYSTLRSFKHDYSNIMLSMKGYIESGDIEGLRIYFDNEIIPANRKLSKNTSHLNQLMNLKIMELKSIVSAKLLYAMEQGINVDIEIMEEIKDIAIDTFDLSRILGIFFDNAIEATMETDQPLIRFAIINLEKEHLLIIANTFLDHGIPIAALRQPLVSIKGPNRGIGLYNVQEILTKYKGVFWDTECLDACFIQRLRILKQ